MIARALSIGVTTAMMCGGQASIGRLRYYKQQMMRHVPVGGTLFKLDTDLCEIAICSTAVPTWTYYRVREKSWSERFRAVFVVGTRKFASEDLMESEDSLLLMVEAVRKLVDINCEYVESPDVVGDVWNI